MIVVADTSVILNLCRKLTLIPALAPLLDRLQHDARFSISASLHTAILSAAGESSCPPPPEY